MRSPLAQVTAAFNALQKGAAAQKRLPKHGLKQASEFASTWDSIMATIAGKREELHQLATVGVDVDMGTVRSQLDDYKVGARVCGGEGGGGCFYIQYNQP